MNAMLEYRPHDGIFVVFQSADVYAKTAQKGLM